MAWPHCRRSRSRRWRRPQENQLPAPETTATANASDFELAEVAAAPVQGQPTNENSNAIPTWRSAVVALLERNKRYPTDARDARGVAQIAFSLDRQGRVTRSQILSSSGSAALDHEASKWCGDRNRFLRRRQRFQERKSDFQCRCASTCGDIAGPAPESHPGHHRPTAALADVLSGWLYGCSFTAGSTPAPFRPMPAPA